MLSLELAWARHEFRSRMAIGLSLPIHCFIHLRARLYGCIFFLRQIRSTHTDGELKGKTQKEEKLSMEYAIGVLIKGRTI